jgi:hypothetical protein
MISIKPCQLPNGALLKTYLQTGAYTDSYKTDISGTVTHAQYVHAFYTTAIFKLERSILKWAVSRPSSDAQAAQLADGNTDTFSAWTVETRCKNQLLMCDFQGRTRSWLMIEPVEGEDGIKTRLYFGSAVLPMKNNKTGKTSLGPVFHALLGFHKIYSVVLLYSAKTRLKAHRA